MYINQLAIRESLYSNDVSFKRNFYTTINRRINPKCGSRKNRNHKSFRAKKLPFVEAQRIFALLVSITSRGGFDRHDVD